MKRARTPTEITAPAPGGVGLVYCKIGEDAVFSAAGEVSRDVPLSVSGPPLTALALAEMLRGMGYKVVEAKLAEAS